jgi:predicted ATP-grasp superfamily ATP-dependent carboligase
MILTQNEIKIMKQIEDSAESYERFVEYFCESDMDFQNVKRLFDYKLIDVDIKSGQSFWFVTFAGHYKLYWSKLVS